MSASGRRSRRILFKFMVTWKSTPSNGWSSGHTAYIDFGDNTHNDFIQDQFGNLVFNVSLWERMRITGGGSVGIGTSTPLALLNAYGGVINDTQSIAATSTDGVLLSDLTAATVGTQQWSPRVHWSGQGWKTNATAASEAVDIIEELQPVSGAAAPTGNLVFSE